VQICLNGREWLSRQMDREGLEYVRQDNCFPWLANYERAQQLLHALARSWLGLGSDNGDLVRRDASPSNGNRIGVSPQAPFKNSPIRCNTLSASSFPGSTTPSRR
jgi:hypothetical protein